MDDTKDNNKNTERYNKALRETKQMLEYSKTLKEVYKDIEGIVGKIYFGKNAERGKKLVSELNDQLNDLYKQAEKKSDSLAKPFEKLQSKIKKDSSLSSYFDNRRIDVAVRKFKKNIQIINRQRISGQIGGVKSFGKTTAASLSTSGQFLRSANYGKILSSPNYGKILGAGFKGSKSLLSAGGLAGKLRVLSKLGLVAGGASLLIAPLRKIFDTMVAVDKATADFIKTTGVLDRSFSSTLIKATESASLLGGNIQLAAQYGVALINQLSPAINLTDKLIANVAQIGERFGLGTEVAAKFTRIVSELSGNSIEQASNQTEKFIEGLGRLGPAVIRNIVSSYDSVIDKFGMGLEQLQKQGLAATKLGISLSKAADVAGGLLDFQTSITNEFQASALLGQAINFNKARELALNGDIIGATNQVLDQVEQLGDLNDFEFFQRQQIAKAAGLTVSELQKEIRLRKQIGVQDRISSATRESALGKIDEITRRIQNAFFRVFASPSFQNTFENAADALIKFIEGDTFQSVVDGIGGFVESIGQLINKISGGGPLLKVGFGEGGLTISPTKTINDGVIKPDGTIIKTNPMDYLFATTSPEKLIPNAVETVYTTPTTDKLISTNPNDYVTKTDSGDKSFSDSQMKEIFNLISNNSNSQNQTMNQLLSLLGKIDRDGLSANVYLDGKKLSAGIASSMR